MRKMVILMVLAVIFLSLTGADLLAKGNGALGGNSAGGYYDYPDGEEIAALQHMREEEKLARDVYRLLFDVWGSPIFSNIAASEQQHMDALGRLITKYGLIDPVGDNGPGVFENVELQNLYDELTAAGQVSLVDALIVGASIEDLDIADLIEAYCNTDNQDLQTVYLNLTKGSRNHLRAFVSEIEQRGVQYPAQYLDQQAVDEILSGLSAMRGITTG